MNKGACWHHIKGKQLRLRRASKILAAGTRLQLFYDDKVLGLKPANAELLQDLGRYSLWFKPHGLLAQGSQWGDHCSLLRQVEQARQRDVFLVHRLDGDAAGIMLIAHDGQAAAALSQLFQGRELDKYYQAWVEGELHAQQLRLDSPVDGKEAISWVTTSAVTVNTAWGNTAQDNSAQDYLAQGHSTKNDSTKNDSATTIATDISATEPAQVRSLVQVKIDTGRKHQIRRHLAGIGHPIVGDRLYGNAMATSRKNTAQPLQLLAYQVRFFCPLLKRQISVCLPEKQQFQPSDY